MANPFDQFDEQKPAQSNPFDQFDEQKPAQSNPFDQISIAQDVVQQGARERQLDPMIGITEELRQEKERNRLGDLEFHRQNKQRKWEIFKEKNPIAAKNIEEMGGVEAFLIGAGEGFTNVGRGVGLVDQADESELEAAEMLRGQRGSALAGTLVGETAPFVAPGMAVGKIASTGGRIAAGAGLGAAEGNILARGSGGDSADIVAGTLGGAVLGGGAELLSPLVRVASGQRSTVQAPEGLVDRAARSEVFEEVGVTPTQANITQDTRLMQKQADLAGQEGPVRDVMDVQNEQITEALDMVGAKTGGSAEDVMTAYEAVQTKAATLDDQVSQIYTAVENNLPGEKVVKFDSTSKFLKDFAGEGETSKVLGPLKARMQQMGLLEQKTLKPIGRISPKQAEGLRKYANELSQSANALDQKRIRQFKDSIDDDVFRAGGKDFYEEARGAKTQYERELDPDKRDKFDKRKVSLVRDIRDNKLTTDDFEKKIFGAGSTYKSQDLEDLKDYIGADSQAWKNVNAAAMQKFRQKAVDSKGRVTPRSYQAAVDSIGIPKLRVLYGDEGVDFIKKVRDVVELKEIGPKVSAVKIQAEATGRERLKRLGERMSKLPFLGVIGDIIDIKLQQFKRFRDQRKVLGAIDSVEDVVTKMEKKAATQNIRQNPATSAAQAAVVPSALRQEEIESALQDESSKEFDSAFQRTMKNEGGFVNDSSDSGGVTKFGLSIRAMKKLNDPLLDKDGDGVISEDDVKNFTEEDAKRVYRNEYWQDGFSQDIGSKLFDFSVNAGKKRANKILQKTLNEMGKRLRLDGVAGPETKEAANSVNQQELMQRYKENMRQFYIALADRRPKDRKFLRGWLNRVDS